MLFRRWLAWVNRGVAGDWKPALRISRGSWGDGGE